MVAHLCDLERLEAGGDQRQSLAAALEGPVKSFTGK